jgi:cytochrome oxidase Cu insertion factor (SCO1/SenC/PrrC family)
MFTRGETMKRRFSVLALVGLMGTTGCATFRVNQYRHELRAKWANKVAPDFELTALDGGKIALHDLRGKPVLLAFWAHG